MAEREVAAALRGDQGRPRNTPRAIDTHSLCVCVCVCVCVCGCVGVSEHVS